MIKHYSPLFGMNDTWVIQRIKVDEPVLAKFNSGDDEYLVKDALIFWQVFPVDEARPKWSPVGIPHSSIEVLHPHGHWESLAAASFFGDKSLIGWEADFLTGWGGGPCPCYFRSLIRRDNDCSQVWIHLRQPDGPWTSLLNAPDLLARFIQRMFWRYNDLRTDQIRWIFSFETAERVVSYEIFPTISHPNQTNSLAAVLRRYLRIADNNEIIVGLDDESRRDLSSEEQRLLYADFTIPEVLQLADRWSYPHAVLSL